MKGRTAVHLYVLLYYALYFILPTLLITESGHKKLHNFFLCFHRTPETTARIKAERFNELQLQWEKNCARV